MYDFLLQVLVVLGVSKVFETKVGLFQKLGDFGRYWSLFLEYLEGTALSQNDEVSQFFPILLFKQTRLMEKKLGFISGFESFTRNPLLEN